VPVTITIALEGAASPDGLGSLVMYRRKMPKMARATAKIRRKISLRCKRLFALVLRSGRERRPEVDPGCDEDTGVLASD
jgi:hypothetical protein